MLERKKTYSICWNELKSGEWGVIVDKLKSFSEWDIIFLWPFLRRNGTRVSVYLGGVY